MATTETLTFNVKSNIGKTAKDASELASEFKLMGVSLNDVRNGFRAIARTAAASFATINKAIKTSIIGVFIAAIASLVTYFTQSKRGAEQLGQALAGLTAGFNVLVDRVIQFGEGLGKLLSGNLSGLTQMKNAFKDIGVEIANDVREATALEEAFQRLKDSNRELNVETARRRAEIEALKLIAEDTTKSEEERLAAAQKAFKIENDLLSQRIANAEEGVRIQREQNEINESSEADLDALAQREIELFNIRQESTTKQIELNNKINSIKREAEAKELEALQALKDAEAERLGELERISTSIEQAYDKQQKAITNLMDTEKQFFNEKVEQDMTIQQLSEQRVEWAAMSDKERMNIASTTAKNMSKVLGEESEAGKAFAIMATTVDTFQSAQSAFKSMAGIPVVGPALGAVAAAAAVAAGMKNIAAIKSAKKGGGGGASIPAAAPAATPAPQMMSGEFDLTGGIEPEPTKAFVVTDEMTDSQNQLANIRRRATI